MKKRRKVGVWLLIFMLVLTQISLPGARVQANGNDVSSVAMTEGEADSKEKAEEGSTAAKSKSTEAESNKTPEKTDASDEEKSSESSEKTEKTTSAEEETDKKDVAEEENKEKNDKTESGESVKKTESDSEKQTEEEKDKTDSETEKAPDQSTEGTENKTETSATDETDSTAKAKSAPNAAVKEDNEQIYQVKIQPVDKDGDDISGANITLESSTNPGIASSWSSVDPVDGQYQLTEKDGENVCYYRFSITATDYEQFASESFSFTQESNPYFYLKNVENGMITIQPALTKVSKQYQVKIQAVDEDKNPISKPNITLETSTDKNTWTEKSKNSAGVYQLDEKEGDDVCYYRFSITATDYYKFTSDTFTFTEANSYFDINSIGDETITIQPVMEKKPTQYRVTIAVLDEQGDPLSDVYVEMKWRKDSYKSYIQEPVSSEKNVYEYDLYAKDTVDLNHVRFYQFKVYADEYTSYESSEFCFDSRWWNPYFNADTAKQSVTITIRMTLAKTTLENAKTNAIYQLENYKKLEDYRQEEQEQIKNLVETWTEKIKKATSVSSVTWNLNAAKGRLDALKTKLEYENEEYRSRIYFQTIDGQKTYVDEYGVVTLTNIDDGNFYITHPDGSLYQNNEWDAKWRCVYEYNDLDHPDSIAFNVIVGTYGQYAGKFIGKYDATVTLSDLGRAIHFTVRVIDGRVDRLRAYVDGKDVSGKTIQVMGSEKKHATIQGRLKGTNRWIAIPAHALKYVPGGSTKMDNVTAEFRTWGTTGSITYYMDADRSVSTTIYISATIVHPTGVRVECPSKATVGDWNGAFNQYVGIMEGQGPGYYHVVVTPSNASNQRVIWEDLTPDVATFQSLHAAGIVPKKAGTARFKVSCVDNPSINTTVSILFQYEKPLKTAEAEKDVYYAKPSDKSINLVIITNGQKDSSKGASEQRFHWTYSTSGVAKITDSVHYDKSSVTIPNWFTHTISVLGEGTVTVTGTPWDGTENCKPVKFKVVVSSDVNKDKEAAERVEKLILAIGTVTLEKKSQIQNARAEFQALTSTQKGLVDDEIYAKLVAAELELRRLERGDSDDDAGGDGGNSSGGNGSNSGGTGYSDPSGGDGTDSAGGGGAGVGESGIGNDSSMAGTGDQSAADAAAYENAVARRRTNSPAVVQAKNTNNTDTSAGKKAGAKGSGKKFYEIDIQDIPKEVIEIVDSISPETKIAVVVCVLIAFIYGFMRRRRQHLSEEKEQTLYKD